MLEKSQEEIVLDGLADSNHRKKQRKKTKKKKQKQQKKTEEMKKRERNKLDSKRKHFLSWNVQHFLCSVSIFFWSVLVWRNSGCYRTSTCEHRHYNSFMRGTWTTRNNNKHTSISVSSIPGIQVPRPPTALGGSSLSSWHFSACIFILQRLCRSCVRCQGTPPGKIAVLTESAILAEYWSFWKVWWKLEQNWVTSCRQAN